MFVINNVAYKILRAEFIAMCRPHAKLQALIHVKSSLFPKKNTESSGLLYIFVNYKNEILAEVAHYLYSMSSSCVLK